MSHRFVTMEVNGHQNGLVNILQNTNFLFHRRFLVFGWPVTLSLRQMQQMICLVQFYGLYTHYL